ncbi:hypothetical protein NQ095_19085 [Rossellomorea sp. SC111]|uniref:hypothetical protein n=1 Tax=Rossellomorea sp. SC111 TaxID=2968985 RepID=UPI00215A5732|nr:hypothetical protein [Rossellomorea sp. SC111]MCR8850528.1 hypothetical protein [Rossellomorea sp. SC111]
MKTFSLIMLAVGCAAVLFYGNAYWQERSTPDAGSHHPSKLEKTSSEPVTEETTDYGALVSNWPEKAQDTFLNDIRENTPYQLAIVGSTALREGENGWSEQVKEKLEGTFG